MVKDLPANEGDAGLVLGQEDPLEEGIATHSSILAWTIPWTEGYSLWGYKELDMTQQLNKSKHVCVCVCVCVCSKII